MLPAAAAMVAIVCGAPPTEGATSPGVISTQAGGPGRGLVHNVAQEANGVATGPDGSVYASDVQGVVRQFNDTSTWEKAIAGLGKVIGFGGDGGPATAAEMRDPTGVTVDGSGNLLISDSLNQRVRLVAVTSGTYYGTAVTGGDIVTVAGNGVAGFLGDSHQASSAELNSPQATAVDGSGNLLIADTGNGRVREVSGQPPTANA
jgi:hypothetical protein